MGRFGPNRYGADGGLLLGIGCSVVVHVSCADSLLSSMFLFVLVLSCSFFFCSSFVLALFLARRPLRRIGGGFCEFLEHGLPKWPERTRVAGGRTSFLEHGGVRGWQMVGESGW